MGNRAIGLSCFWRGGYFTRGGPVTQILSQRIGAIFAWCAYRVGLSPNSVTILAGVISLVGVTFLSAANHSFNAQLISLLLLHVGYGLDCADGQLARATGRTSAFGAWLDIFVDAIVINAISLALVIVVIDADRYSVLNIIAIFLLNSARISHLYSVPAKKRDGDSMEKSLAAKYLSRVKGVAWMIIDTPVFLFAIVLLAGLGGLMTTYILVMAVLYYLAALNNATVLAHD